MPEITDNPEKKQFEYIVNGKTSFVEYIITSKGVIFLTHTEVPKPLRGQGIAFEMISEVLNEVEKRELKLVPLCPTVAEYIRRNPNLKYLLASGYSV